MADFRKALAKVLHWEGGWYDGSKSYDSNPTNYGITLNTFQTMYGKGKTAEDLKNIDISEVRKVYRVLFWDRIKGDQIRNQSVAELLFDFCVNSGVATAVKKTQAIVGAYQDGIVGNITLTKMNAYEPQKSLFELLKEQRRLFYNSIVTRKPEKRVCLKGWLNRLDSYKYEE